MIMKKLRQIVALLTVVLIFVVVAVQHDQKVFGVELKGSEETATQIVQISNDTLTTEADGTMVVNTTPLGKEQKIVGYAGFVPLKIYVKEGVVQKVEALENNETPSFFNNALTLIDSWNGKSVDEALALKVDAVSGATFSSNAIKKNVKVGLQYLQPTLASTDDGEVSFGVKDIAALVVVLISVVVPLFVKNRKVRIAQLILNVVVLGLWSGTFLSYSLIVNYFANGFHSLVAIIPIIMFIAAFVFPLFGKNNHYCMQVCPFGSAQELMGIPCKKKWMLGSQTLKALEWFRKLLWAVLLLLLLTGVYSEWMNYELFTAFIFQSAAVGVEIAAVLFLLLSIFVPRPYCRFVCPMGMMTKVVGEA